MSQTFHLTLIRQVLPLMNESDVVEYSTLLVNDVQSEDVQEKHLNEPKHHKASRRGALNIHRSLNSSKQSKERRNQIHVEKSQNGSSGSSAKHSYITATGGSKVISILQNVKPRDVFFSKK
jgi:hypothetical protein